MEKPVMYKPSNEVLFWVWQNRQYQKMGQARREAYERLGNLPRYDGPVNNWIVAPRHLAAEVQRLMT